MSGKFLAMIVFIYIILAFLGTTFEGQTQNQGTWAGTGSGGQTISPIENVQTLGTLAKGGQTLSFFGVVELPVQIPGWLGAAYRVITLQFSFLMTGGYVMFYWIFLLPIAIAGVTSFIMLFIGTIRGNISWS